MPLKRAYEWANYHSPDYPETFLPDTRLTRRFSPIGFYADNYDARDPAWPRTAGSSYIYIYLEPNQSYARLCLDLIIIIPPPRIYNKLRSPKVNCISLSRKRTGSLVLWISRIKCAARSRKSGSSPLAMANHGAGDSIMLMHRDGTAARSRLRKIGIIVVNFLIARPIIRGRWTRADRRGASVDDRVAIQFSPRRVPGARIRPPRVSSRVPAPWKTLNSYPLNF